MTGG
jgi:hypothetical protein